MRKGSKSQRSIWDCLPGRETSYKLLILLMVGNKALNHEENLAEMILMGSKIGTRAYLIYGNSEHGGLKKTFVG